MYAMRLVLLVGVVGLGLLVSTAAWAEGPERHHGERTVVELRPDAQPGFGYSVVSQGDGRMSVRYRAGSSVIQLARYGGRGYGSRRRHGRGHGYNSGRGYGGHYGRRSYGRGHNYRRNYRRYYPRYGGYGSYGGYGTGYRSYNPRRYYPYCY